jgi:hypothetical protein
MKIDSDYQSRRQRTTIQLQTDWTPEIADAIIDLLDDVRGVITAAYAGEIAALYQAQHSEEVEERDDELLF